MVRVTRVAMVGREEELAYLTALLDEARAGGGGAVAVRGEAGIGKSRLIAETADLARSRDMVVLLGRAQADPQPAYHSLGIALAGTLHERRVSQAPDVAPFLAAVGRALSLVGAPQAPGPIVGDSPAIVAEGVLRLLRRLGDGRGLLLVLEDVHWADPDTLGVVERLTDDLRFTSSLLVMTQRTDDPSPAGDRLGELIARRAVSSLTLEALHADEVDELARRLLEVELLPPDLQAALRERAEGVPFLVEEIVSAPYTAPSLSPSYQTLVDARLAHLDPTMRRVVEAAAVVGRIFDWRLVGAALALDEQTVLHSLRAADQSQLIGEAPDRHIGGFAFRHALAREAVLSQLARPERSVLALAIAEAIEDRHPGLPGALCEQAATLRDEGGDRLGAVRLLHESATRALGRGALASAEAALLRARELAADDPMAWAGPDELLARVYQRAGQTEPMLELVERVVSMYEHYQSLGGILDRPTRVAQLHLLVARSALPRDPGLAAGRLALARDQLAGGEPEDIEADIVGIRLDLLGAGGDPGLSSRADDANHRAVLQGRTDLALEALALGAEAAARGGAWLEARRRLEDVVRASRVAHHVLEGINALLALGHLDRCENGSVERVYEARALAIGAGALDALVRCDLELAKAYLDAGRLDQATTPLHRAVEVASRVAQRHLPELLVAQAAVTVMQESAAEARRLVAQAVEATAVGDRARIRALAHGEVFASAALVRGDLNGANREYEAAIQLTAGHVFAAEWDERPDRWEAMRGLLAAATQAHHRGEDPLVIAVASYSAAIRYGRDGDVAAAAAAIADGDAAAPPGWRREVARLIVAQAALKDDWSVSSALATEAAAYFEAVGLRRAAGWAHAVMRKSGIPVHRRGRGAAEVPADMSRLGVSSREMDVLLLVGDGLSNQAIGERLFLSPRTVESHVASLLRKTGRGSRSELVALGARQPGREAELDAVPSP
jgi:DNA-binding CsgD family transcriptional regulator